MFKRNNNRKGLIFILIFVFVFIIVSNISLIKLIKIPSDFYVSYDEIDRANKEDLFGNFVELKLKENEIKTGKTKVDEGEIVFKLFGFIPIKKVKVKLLPEEEVYIGGSPLGISLQTDGVMVVSNAVYDVKNPELIKNNIFKSGYIIKEINGKKVSTLKDVDKVLENIIDSEKVEIIFNRQNEEIKEKVSLLKENEKYKLGLWVRDDISGVGTLTFVRKDNNQFAALGHAVTDGKKEDALPLIGGEVYKCSLVNIKKGEKNNPGELQCVFVNKNKKGNINQNTNVGIFGVMEQIEDMVDVNKSTLLGGRLSVKPGKAKIVSSISGISEEYDIEIIKTNFQSKCSDKSLIIRVVDERLLNLTGGIVQGMSGSPIIQNEKIVGAVTHVFLSDPTKGYGVYSDWMLEQMIDKSA